jgi:5-methylcytosine-specific restriction enzyme A
MSTFILTWNPDVYDFDDGEYESFVASASQGIPFEFDWSVGVRKSGIVAGDRAFLLRQHRDRGIVASGHFLGPVYQDAHYNDPHKQANYGNVQWTAWLSVEDRLPVETLLAEVPQVAWNHMQGSGVRVPDDAADYLGALWEEHTGEVPPPRLPEEPPPGTYREGTVERIEVNRYERDPRARRACLQHWGHDCVVCGFSFKKTYGALGEGFIHVHHLRELSTVPADYEVDPVIDMRPVCPNCHAMLHRRQPALTPDELQGLLSGA